MECGHEVEASPVIAGGDPAPVLEFVEGPFDEVSLFVHLLVVRPNDPPAGPGRYDGDGSLPLDEAQNCVAVISLVCEHVVGLDPAQEGYALRCVPGLASGKDEAYGLAVRIGHHVNLRAQSPP